MMSARSEWPVRVFKLGEEPGDDLSATTSPEERLAMVAALTLEAWTLAGRVIPEYTRGATPVSRRPWPPVSPGSGR
jgi:hypothetical protein